jgi:hypothetical protein
MKSRLLATPLPLPLLVGMTVLARDLKPEITS